MCAGKFFSERKKLIYRVTTTANATNCKLVMMWAQPRIDKEKEKKQKIKKAKKRKNKKNKKSKQHYEGGKASAGRKMLAHSLTNLQDYGRRWERAGAHKLRCSALIRHAFFYGAAPLETILYVTHTFIHMCMCMCVCVLSKQ